MHIYAWVIIYPYIFFLCLPRGPIRNDIPIVTSTPNTQILVFNTILQRKVPGLLGEMADSRTWAGNMQGKTRASCSARKSFLKKAHTYTMMEVCQIDPRAN